ncbi:MAG TPA: hypothetical protein VIL09_19800 [Microvirga sp.]
MSESLDEIVYAVGGALVSPGPGSAELILAALVAAVFVASAVKTLVATRSPTRRSR